MVEVAVRYVSEFLSIVNHEETPYWQYLQGQQKRIDNETDATAKIWTYIRSGNLAEVFPQHFLLIFLFLVSIILNDILKYP